MHSVIDKYAIYVTACIHKETKYKRYRIGMGMTIIIFYYA